MASPHPFVNHPEKPRQPNVIQQNPCPRGEMNVKWSIQCCAVAIKSKSPRPKIASRAGNHVPGELVSMSHRSQINVAMTPRQKPLVT